MFFCTPGCAGIFPFVCSPAAPGHGAATPSRQAPDLLRRPSGLGAPPVSGLHLTFGDDPTAEMVVSWTTYEPVRAPRVLLGTAVS